MGPRGGVAALPAVSNRVGREIDRRQRVACWGWSAPGSFGVRSPAAPRCGSQLPCGQRFAPSVAATGRLDSFSAMPCLRSIGVSLASLAGVARLQCDRILEVPSEARRLGSACCVAGRATVRFTRRTLGAVSAESLLICKARLTHGHTGRPLTREE